MTATPAPPDSCPTRRPTVRATPRITPGRQYVDLRGNMAGITRVTGDTVSGNPGDIRTTADLEQQALEIAQHAVREGRVYGDAIALLDQVVREAYERGGERVAVELADAYCLFILDDDDLDSFRDALTE